MRPAYDVRVILRDLGWLVQLDELRHVTETAAAVGTSQPTLSRALARVEDELGVRVFERTSTGVEPTPDGRVVLDAARDLVARHDKLRADLANRLDPDAGPSGSRSSTRWQPPWCPSSCARSTQRRPA
ncbi:hypothetical protein GCM10023339_07730 [Alloalcanivorax gelatiniphagus]